MPPINMNRACCFRELLQKAQDALLGTVSRTDAMDKFWDRSAGGLGVI